MSHGQNECQLGIVFRIPCCQLLEQSDPHHMLHMRLMHHCRGQSYRAHIQCKLRCLVQRTSLHYTLCILIALLVQKWFLAGTARRTQTLRC